MALPALVPLFWGGLTAIVGNIVYKTAVSIGIGFVTFYGISKLFDNIKDEILGQFNSLPAEMMDILSYMKVGVSLNIIFSAFAVRLLLAGLDKVGDSITSKVFKK